jgi:hypothetical protein
METDPVSEKLCFLFVEIRMMDKVQKLNSNEIYNKFNTLNVLFLQPWVLNGTFMKNLQWGLVQIVEHNDSES